MTKTFGVKSQSSVQTAQRMKNVRSAQSATAESGKTAQPAKIVFGIISIAAVGIALWALITGAAPFPAIFAAMLMFAICMAAVGHFMKRS